MKKPELIIIRPQGGKKPLTDFEFKDNLDQILKENPKKNILINLTELEYVNSIFLWAMLATKRKMEKKGFNLKVCNPSTFVKQVFDMVKFEKMVEVFYDEEEALNYHALKGMDSHFIENCFQKVEV